MGDAYDAMQATDPVAYERRLREAKDAEISSLRAALEEARNHIRIIEAASDNNVANWRSAVDDRGKIAKRLEAAQAKITAVREVLERRYQAAYDLKLDVLAILEGTGE